MKKEWLMGAYLSVIGACNYNCVYCSASKQIANNVALTYENFLKIVRIFETKKVCKLNITGGEPFLHKDIEKMIEVSVQKFSVTVLTNGSFIESHLDFLCTSQQILDTNFKKLFSCIVRLYKQYGTLDITLRNVGQLSPTVLDS